MSRARDDGSFDALTEALVKEDLLRPVSSSDAEARRWMDCDLCSFIENRCHAVVSPESLSDAERASWSARALTGDEVIGDPRIADYMRAFWICDGGEHVGTIALGTSTIGGPFVPLYSLYVLPAHRARGIAERTLRSIHAQAMNAGFWGIRITTDWTWQRALRFYLFTLGMWACSFKRSIVFVWSRSLPRYVLDVRDDVAQIFIEGHHEPLIVARRDGERLSWHESRALTASDGVEWDTRMDAMSTLAVAIATHGWPLVRSREELAESFGCDGGGPEVLAIKIAIFEWLDRKNGFDVRTPRIPGLPYAEVEARMRR